LQHYDKRENVPAVYLHHSRPFSSALTSLYWSSKANGGMCRAIFTPMAGTTSPTTLLNVATLSVGSIRLQRSARIGGHGSPAVARLHYVRPRTHRRLHPSSIWVLALEGKEAMQITRRRHSVVVGVLNFARASLFG